MSKRPHPLIRLYRSSTSRLSPKPGRKSGPRFFFLLGLPNELIILICRQLDKQKDINNFSRCSRRLHDLLNFEIYRHDIVHFAGSALVWAAQKGHAKTVERMLQYGADPTRCLEPTIRQPPLMLAVSAGHLPIVNLLLDSPKCRIDQSDSMGSTALSLAVGKNNRELVELLLRHGARGNTLDPLQQNPLAIALKRRYKDIARLLIATETIDVNFEFNKFRAEPCLHHVVRKGSSDVLSLLLARQDLQLNNTAENGDTALMVAAKEGRHWAAKALIARGACPHIVNRQLQSVLFFAARHGHDKIVSMLLGEPRVDIESTSSSGSTPLMEAATNGHKSTFQLLITRGANLSVQDRLGRSVLSVAAVGGSSAMVNLLLELDGVDLEHKCRAGETPLSLAISVISTRSIRDLAPDRAKLLEVAQILLSTGNVNPDSKNQNGRTPLSFAAEIQDAALVELLLAQPSVDPDAKDNNGRTPLLHTAVQRFGGYCRTRQWDGEDEIAVMHLLLNTGRVNVNTQDHFGRTALSYVAGSGCETLVGILLENQADPKLADNAGHRPLYYAKLGLKNYSVPPKRTFKNTIALLKRHTASRHRKERYLCMA